MKTTTQTTTSDEGNEEVEVEEEGVEMRSE